MQVRHANTDDNVSARLSACAVLDAVLEQRRAEGIFAATKSPCKPGRHPCLAPWPVWRFLRAQMQHKGWPTAFSRALNAAQRCALACSSRPKYTACLFDADHVKASVPSDSDLNSHGLYTLHPGMSDHLHTYNSTRCRKRNLTLNSMQAYGAPSGARVCALSQHYTTIQIIKDNCVITKTCSCAMQDKGIRLQYLTQYSTGVFDEGAAEAASYDPASQSLVFTSANEESVEVLDLSGLAAGAQLPDPSALPTPDGYNPSSVSVSKGLIAVALQKVRTRDVQTSQEKQTPTFSKLTQWHAEEHARMHACKRARG